MMIAAARELQIDRVQAEWVLGRLPARRLPEIARQAIGQGFQGPNLQAMARPRRTDEMPDEIVEGALRELGREPITALEAVRRLAGYIAARILRKQLSPVDGAYEIAGLLRRFDRDELPPLLGEFRWSPDGTRQWLADERRIVELSWMLLEDGD
jgi:hypothetical protein